MRFTVKLTIAVIISAVYSLASAQSGKKSGNYLAEATMAISASDAVYFQAFVKNDQNIFIERYAKDACILAPNASPMCGREAIGAFFKLAYNDLGLRNGKFATTAIYGSDKEFVVQEGTWQSIDAAGKLMDDGKFLVLWKKTADGWKMFRDSFSSNHVQANK